MYRRGLTVRRIAELVGAPSSTVHYHLRLASAADAGLRHAHGDAAGSRPSRVTAHGLELMQELVTMVQETGRYSSRNAASTSERTLAVWFHRRRVDARTGRLAPAFREGLTVLPGWEGKPRAQADEQRWQERLAALKAFRAAGNDWPRHKATISGEEHDLGVWLHTQRYKQRRGELDAKKAAALDKAVPGWRVGRKRGWPAASFRVRGSDVEDLRK
jgi:hypothetical protein